MKPKGRELAEAVIEILQAERERRGLSYGKVAESARLDHSTISRSLRKTRTPSLWLAYDMASAMGLSLSEVIERAEAAMGE